MEIRIAHLYPELLNLYGDKGNIASLKYRLEKRGYSCVVDKYNPGDEICFEKSDIVYIGGGTDKDNNTALCELLKHKEQIKAYAENGGVILAVCGGFEFLGKYIETDGKKLDALGVLDAYTVYGKKRHIGNIVIDSVFAGDKIVGFENHSGDMYINGAQPLGSVVSGYGNGGTKGTEGMVYKNVVASYMHGPLLPKNPKLCDAIILKALEKHGVSQLEAIDDTLENAAHEYAVKRFSQKN